jgi:hypothetical protein
MSLHNGLFGLPVVFLYRCVSTSRFDTYASSLKYCPGVSHPAKELEYHFQNAECSFALVDKSMHSRLATALGSDRTKPLIDIEQAIQEGAGSTSTEVGF